MEVLKIFDIRGFYYIYICGVFKQSQILTWRSDFGLFGLVFHDDGFDHISKKTSLEEFHVKFKWN